MNTVKRFLRKGEYRPVVTGGLVVAVALVAAVLPAQVAEKANQGYQTEEQRKRVASNLDNPDRVERQRPAELLAELKINKGDTVADIGTGVGFMVPYLVDAVGPTGTVWAEDIQDDFLAKVKEKIKANGWSNVKTVKGGQTDVKLPAGSLDLGFILARQGGITTVSAETIRRYPRRLSPPQLSGGYHGDGPQGDQARWPAGGD